MGRGSVWEGRVRLARREEGADPQRSVTDKQRRQRALPSQTLRAAGLSGLDCVGSGRTNRRRSAPPLNALPNPEFPSRRTPLYFQTGSKEIPIASKAKNMGYQFRGTRQTADGHYWVCLMDEQKIVELSPTGVLLREIPVEGYPHAALRLPNEHLLVTLGPTMKVVELDKKLNVVWQISGDDLLGNPLRLPPGCQRLSNGNTIISNYLPGPFLGKQPQAFEVTRKKQAVWEFTDNARFKTVNQICVLDGSGGRAGTELR